jgi:hypothetical protein
MANRCSLSRMVILVGNFWLLLLSSNSSSAQTPVSYFVLAQTVEPLMIVRNGDPMAGGLFTDILKKVFENSEYVIEPSVMPWQRMKEEFRQSDNWVTYGFRDGFEDDIPFELSSISIFPFNHVAATLADSNVSVTKVEDLFGRTVILVENFHYPGLDSYLTNPSAGIGNGQIQSVRAFDIKGTLQMLKHRRGDAVFDWKLRLVHNLPKANMKLDEIRFQDASAIIPTREMYFAYSPNWSESFKKFVHNRLKSLKADGTLDTILRKYGGS